MRYMIAVQIVAIFCALLVLSIPAVSAMNVRVFMPGSQVPAQEFAYNPASKIGKTIEIVHDNADVRWENVWVKIGVVGKDLTYEVKNIYLYRCRDKEPAACSSQKPIEATNYLSGDRASFKWGADIMASGKANFMTIVQMEHGGRDIWIGFFDSVTRKSTTEFEISASEIDAVSIFAKDGASAALIKNHIEEYLMAPAEWAGSAELGKAGGSDITTVYRLSAGREDMKNISSSIIAGNMVSSFPKNFSFLFGKGASLYPFTFTDGQPTRCGDTQCDLILGEDTVNCCIDCGCPSGQDCTANADAPIGLCHTCGDGSISPVENWTNCCADAGCIDGKYCDKTITPPYGRCVNASCGQKGCEETENSINCAKDCWNTAGKTCPESYNDPSYYYSPSLKDCVKAECGNNACEPLGGETSVTCCKDCITQDPCPAGEYCNTAISTNGLCMKAGCSTNGCEPGETYENCCTDCNTCPVKGGKQLVCEQNVCHYCGNGIYEEPAETEENCCKDSGCSTAGDYCSDGGPCLPTASMKITATMSPTNGIDCDQGENPFIPSMMIMVVDPPAKTESLSASYVYGGATRQMACTKLSSFSYECELEISGDNIFPGCFDIGEKVLNVTADVGYRKNFTGAAKETIKLSRNVTVDVTDPKDTVCDRNGDCDIENDESESNCCYDCGCTGEEICADSCVPEGSITLTVAESAMQTADCRTGTGYVAFRAYLNHMPSYRHENDLFSFVGDSHVLNYNGKDYTTYNLSGFTCTPEKNMQNKQTGAVNCKIPVSVFPPCPNNPTLGGDGYVSPAMALSVSILGGGLAEKYDDYGMAVSDTFTAKYIQGWSKCGDGIYEEPVETEENCCKDSGCSTAGDYCSDGGPCLPASSMKITATMSPTRDMDCDQGENPNPFIPSVMIMVVDPPAKTESLSASYVYGGATRQMACTKLSSFSYECELEISGDNIFPGCFVKGEKTLTVTADVGYKSNFTGTIKKTIKLSTDVIVDVTDPKDTVCDRNGDCDIENDESESNCCYDCGCTGEEICANNLCVSEGSIKLNADDVQTATDCRTGTGKVAFRASLSSMPDYKHENDPFSFVGDSHVLNYNGKDYTTHNLSGFECDAEKVQNKYNGVVNCEIPVSVFPPCPDIPATGGAAMALSIYILGGGLAEKYDDYGMAVSDTFKAPYTQGWPNCGKDDCQPDQSETEVTCCKDCGCATECAEYDTDGVTCIDETKRFCSLSTSSCSYDDDISLSVELTPVDGKLDCSAPAEEKYLTLSASLSPAPMEMDNPYFTGTSLSVDGSPIDLAGNGFCETQNGGYELVCSIPVSSGSFIFGPCWATGQKSATLATTAHYLSTVDGEERTLPLSKDFTFEVTKVLERECNKNLKCDDGVGELPNQCCPDCGCMPEPPPAAGAARVCVSDFSAQPDYKCEEKSKVSIAAESYQMTVDCPDKMTIDLTVQNMPYNMKSIKWYAAMDRDGDGTAENYTTALTCTQSGTYKDEYTCTAYPTIKGLPVCYIACAGNSCPTTPQIKTSDVTIYANISHYEATASAGELKKDDIVAALPAPMKITAENILPTCSMSGGNPLCQDGTKGTDNFGENSVNCCTDCGCPAGKICTVEGCKETGQLTLKVKDNPKYVVCYLMVRDYDNTKDYEPTFYECQFKCDTESAECEDGTYDLQAEITPEPYLAGGFGIFNPAAPKIYYTIKNYGDPGVNISKNIAIDDNWGISWKPTALGSKTESIRSPIEIVVHIEFTAGDAADPKRETLVHLKDTVQVEITSVETDQLQTVEGNLKDLKKKVEWLALYLALPAGFALGMCYGCAGIWEKNMELANWANILTPLLLLDALAWGMPYLMGMGDEMKDEILLLETATTGGYAGGFAIGAIIKNTQTPPIIPRICNVYYQALCKPVFSMPLVAIGAGAVYYIVLNKINKITSDLEEDKALGESAPAQGGGASQEAGGAVNEYFEP